MSPNFSRPATASPFRSRQAGSAFFNLTAAHCSPASSFLLISCRQGQDLGPVVTLPGDRPEGS
jgi:hypothetical protein